ncbi:MAG: ComEC/Rec2 family competence protein, partial [Oscillospiraceae bacterium]|nr:ComEC/Rec2 family competence protein [Oscillospiraceae bacterium]
MRKLASFAFSFAAAVFAAVYLLPEGSALTAAGVLAVLGAAAFFIKDSDGLRIRIMAFGAAVGMLAFYAGYMLLLTPARELDGMTGEFYATATDFPEKTESGWRVSARIDAGGRAVPGRVYCYDETEIVPGDRLTVTGRARAGDTFYGEESDILLSSGSFLSVYGETEVTESRGFSLFFAPKYLSRAITEKTAEIFTGQVRSFMLALVAGDTGELYADPGFTDALNTAGARHVVVISGMHMAYIVAVIALLFGKRRRVALITVPALIVYAAVTGFTPAITRACIMQAFMLMAPVFNREGDSLTSLSAAMVPLLIINPYAAANIGFQLSFGATLGIVLFSEPIFAAAERLLADKRKKLKRPVKRLLLFIISNLSVTLGASAFTIPILAIRMGYTSIVSPLTNLLVEPAVSLAFLLGLASVAAGFIFAPAGAVFGVVAAIPARYTIWIVKALSRLRFASLYTVNQLTVFWLFYVLAVIILLFVFRRKKAKLFPAVCSSIIALCCVAAATLFTASGSPMEVTVLDVGQGQCIVVTSGNNSAVIDCGSTSGYDAGTLAANYLRSQGRDTIDVLLLTHYHADHTNGADELISILDTDALLAPDKELSDSEGADWLTDLAEDRGAAVIYVTERLTVSLGDAVLEVYPPIGEDSENERGLSIVCSCRDYDVLITGDMPS